MSSAGAVLFGGHCAAAACGGCRPVAACKKVSALNALLLAIRTVFVAHAQDDRRAHDFFLAGCAEPPRCR